MSMEFLTRSASVRDRIRLWRAAGSSVALVPTAGTLHKGHMSLVAEAQERADHVVVSVVSDPGDREPPTLEADRELVQKVGASVLFAPPLQEIYPIGSEFAASVQVATPADELEGSLRAEHFSRAATLLTKLFNLIGPDVAVFGERDFRQLVMVRRLVDDLFLSVEVVSCVTWRDGDGLAVAKANRQMTTEDRALAPRLYATLGEFAARIDAGERDYEALQRQGMDSLRARGLAPEYFAIRQAVDLGKVRPGARDLVLLAAAQLNSHRLTDNLRVRVIDRY
jgi:pantoate--beta-alanine ligase